MFNADMPVPFQSGDPSDAPAYTGELDFTDFEQRNSQPDAGYSGGFDELRLRYSDRRNEHNYQISPQSSAYSRAAS